jgi:hypothetical protein
LIGAASRFRPGDACFTSEVSDEILAIKGEEFRLRFGTGLGRAGDMDGSFGMDSLVIVDPEKKLSSSLQEAYRIIRKSNCRQIEFVPDENGDEIVVELNAVAVFVHNADFRFQQYSPFMRFNENWVREANEMQPGNAFGLGRSKPRISGILPDFDHIEWRDAAEVPPLKHRNRVTPDHPAEIECKAADIKLLLIAKEDLEKLTQNELRDNVDVAEVKLLCVESHAISDFVYKQGRWRPAEKAKETEPKSEE